MPNYDDRDYTPDAELVSYECAECDTEYSLYEDEVNECPHCGNQPAESDYWEPREFPTYG